MNDNADLYAEERQKALADKAEAERVRGVAWRLGRAFDVPLCVRVATDSLRARPAVPRSRRAARGRQGRPR